MKYLTRVHEKSNPRSAAHQNTLMQRLLDSNPILEAFGNAQTLRNNNSSRFGKYIEMHFDIRGSLVGASIQTYLLEKVRVVSHSTGERAFHIFHQLLAGASDSDKCLWRLDDVDRFRYVHQSSTIAQDDVTASEYMQTRMAINTLQFSESNVQDLFSCMAGLLHLGNVEFESAGEGSFLNNVSLKSATNAAELFGVNAQDLIRQLTIRVVETSKDRVEAPRSPSHAADAWDTLAKILYSTLFDFIVRQLNNSVAGGADQAVSTIGVLDIFGFECFAVNSLEQLCINYTNEALQQQFNEFMFKSEQEEYEREQIDFRFVSFPDNTLCLQLIEDRTTGILSILHDQCFIPQPSDEKFVARLYKENATNPYFGATSTQKTNLCFSVKHYAGVVEYTSDQFVEKNRDLLPKESRKLFASSSLSAVNSLFAEFNTIEIPIAGRGGGRGKTVVIQFKDSLRDLMNKIGNTKPHYVRCIKPNDQNVASMFNRRRVCEQLRYGGVLQAVAIARSGFPVKFSHESFYTQYRIILSMKDLSLCHLNEDILPFHIPCGYTKIWDKCLRLISALVHVSSVTPTVRRMAHEELQLGTTKVFLRNKAHELLEAWAARRRFTAATLIQARVRGRVEWRKYLGYSAARRIQKLFKRWIVRLWIFKGNAAIRIQTCYRRHLAIKRQVVSLVALSRLTKCLLRFRLRVFAVRTLQRLHRRRSMSKLAAVVPDYNAAALIIQLRFRRRLAVKRIQQRRASRLAQPPHSEVTSSANQSTVCLGDIADFKDSKEVEYPLAGSSPRFSETKEAEQDTTTSVSTCSFPERPMLRTQHSLNLSQSYINMSSECSVRELTRIMSGQALLEESQTCTGIMQQLNSISGPDEAIEACKSLILLTGRSMPHRTMLGASGACTAVVNILRNYTENRHVVLQVPSVVVPL
jgi:myosin-5